MTMVERVARAIVEETIAATDGPDLQWDQLKASDLAAARFIARAAIEAMREPTEQQLLKMSRAAPEVGTPTIRLIYEAAIDADLTEPEA